MSNRSLIDSMREISEERTRREQDQSGDFVMNERPATYDDYLKAQRSMSFRIRKKGVSFRSIDKEEEENSSELGALSPLDETKDEASERDLRNTTKMLKRMSVTKRGSIQDSNALEAMVHACQVQLKKLDADGIFKDTSLKIPWYAPPLQRQRWGDEHVLPIVNHGTLFFDLFFVGGIYNLCEMITSGVNAESETDGSEDSLRVILYLLGIFGPLFSTWERGVYYQSRYLVADYVHQVFELMRFFGVAAITLFIRPIQELRDPQNVASAFVLVVAFLGVSLTQLALELEVYKRAQGDREAIQNHTWAEMKKGIIPACLTYATSAIIAGVLYFGPFEPLNTGAVWNVTDLPLTLTAAEYLWNLLMQAVGTVHKDQGAADIRKTFVPYNIDFVIQRYSDWFLLLLGETVMAMVETTDDERDYVVAVVGPLILIVLFTLKFESEPENPHGHALWRNKRNAYAFRILMELLSIGIIMMSVTFKILETEGLFGISESHCTIALAVSLGWVLICLELSLVTHKGLSKSWKRLFRRKEDDTKDTIYWPLAGLTLFKIMVLIFLFEIPAWQEDVDIAIILAFFVVLIIALTRIVGWAFVFKEDEIKEMVSTAKSIFKSVQHGESFTEHDKLSAVEEESNASFASSHSHIRRQHLDTYHGMFDAVIFADFEGIIVNVNDVAVSMFRYEAKSDMIGQNLSTLVGSDHAKHHAGYMKKFRDRGGTLLFGKQRKLRARRSTGEEFDCILGIQLAGNGKHVMGFIRDMEDFEDMETYHGMFDAVIFADFEGSIVTVNDVAVKMFRYKEKRDMIGQDISTLVGGAHAKHHAGYMKKFRDRGGTLLFGKQRKLKARRSTGEEFDCILGIQLAGNGKHVIGFIRDMEDFEDDGSDLLLPDIEAKIQKQMKKILDDSSPDSIAVIDTKGNIVGVNRTFVEEFRYDNKEEVLGLDISIIMESQYHEMHGKMMARCRETKEMGGKIHSKVLGKQNLLPVVRKDGTGFKCIIGVNPIDDSDYLVGYIKNFSTLLPGDEKASLLARDQKKNH